MDDMTLAIAGVIQSATDMRNAFMSMDSNLTMVVNNLRQRDATLITLARLYPRLSIEQIVLAAAEQLSVNRGAPQ